MDSNTALPTVDGPLRTLKVLELGHFIAAPFCTRLLADQGADVVKVEPPGGDPARTWGKQVNGQSVMWSLHNRNKRCVTLDLKNPAERGRIEALVAWADVLAENFRPGQLERWSLGIDQLHAINPRLIVARISGYGQDGPYRNRASFGAVGEAFGGVRYLTGYPSGVSDLPPVRTGVSFGDDVAALYAAMGILAAVHERDVLGTGRGRVIDVALFEGVFSLLEGALPEYASCGVVRQPSGSAMPTSVPSDTYRAADGWLVIAGNSDAIFRRLCGLIGRPDMATDERLATNAGRLIHRAEVDAAIAAWVATMPAAEAERVLNEESVPATRAFTVADCVEDPHYQARGMIVDVDDPLIGPTKHAGIVPRFDTTAPTGRIAWPGPGIGQHNAEVFGALAGGATLGDKPNDSH
jgi:crotonobetainyl-CoA:carnitine CoA-transferase CaiB-like acyl-CoA transferase